MTLKCAQEVWYEKLPADDTWRPQKEMREVVHEAIHPLNDSAADQILDWLVQGNWYAWRVAPGRPVWPGAAPPREYRRNPASRVPFLTERENNEKAAASARKQAKTARGARVRGEVLDALKMYGIRAPANEVAGVGAGED